MISTRTLSSAFGSGAAALLFGASLASAVELTGQVAVESRAFPTGALDDRQHETNASIALAPELYWESGDHSVTIAPFGRLDLGDEERTHADLREAFWLYYGGGFDLRVGVRRVFWGVTESQHLVDVINQTDLVENPDGEDKLGQPMVSLSIARDWGFVDLFVLPGFRERTFPGVEGRLRFAPLPIGDAEYESDAEEWHVDWAARWSHTISLFDVALSHFQGTSREPRFLPRMKSDGSPYLAPFYDQIDQTGLELQAITGGWLWKAEAIHRSGQGDTFNALVAGFEYTFVGILGTVADLGAIVEYHHDDRGRDATTPFEDDFFVGGRLALNDVQSTEVLAGVIKDRDTGTLLSTVEASRRFGDRWRLYVEFRGFAGAPATDPFYGLRDDDYAQVELARFF